MTSDAVSSAKSIVRAYTTPPEVVVSRSAVHMPDERPRPRRRAGPKGQDVTTIGSYRSAVAARTLECQSMANKILLVDDSQDLVDSYVTFLEAVASYEVRAATSGRAALELARSWRPDVVVTDIMMPDMNGLELITHMRSELPPPLPLIIAMSGFPDVEREARHRGAEVFQPKPLDAEHLVTLIESLLEHRQPPAHIAAATEARRKQASELAKTAVSAILERRPYFAKVAELGTRVLSRYFDDADAALLLIGDGELKVFASSGWPVGMQPDGVLGYALDVVASGSTLIVPDLAAMPRGSVRATAPEWRLLAAVPVCSMDGTAIGALMVADRRP